MIWQFIKSAKAINLNLQQVEMDTGVHFIQKTALGFKTKGVSSCIVLVGYFKDKLLFMSHHSTPDSRDPIETSRNFVKSLFNHIILKCKHYKQRFLKIYALGGQESSQKTIDAMREFAQHKLRYQLDVDGLHLVHHEDFFNLFVLKNNQAYVVPKTVFPHYQIEEDLKNISGHPAPLLYTLAVVASYQQELLVNQSVENCQIVTPSKKKHEYQDRHGNKCNLRQS